MFCILTLIAQIWLGFELLLPILYPEFRLFSVIGAASLFGPCVSTLLFFIFSYFLGFNFFHLVIHTLLLLILDFFLNKRRKQFDYVFSETVINFAGPIIAFILSFLFIFPSYLPLSNLFLKQMEISLHEEFSLQSSFLYGCNKRRSQFFLIDHPDFFGKHAVSRWLTSCHIAMLRLGFFGIRSALFIDLSLFINSFFFILISFGYEFMLPIFISPFMVFLPFFISGFGYFDFQRNCEKYNLCNSINSRTDYVSYFSSNFPHITFLHSIFHLSVGNVPLLLSLGLCTLTFHLLYRAICCRTSIRLLALAGFIIGGILPCVHYQAFYLMFVFSILNVLFQLWRQKVEYFNQSISFFSSLILSFLVLNSVRYFHDNFFSDSIFFKKLYDVEIENGEIFPFFKYWYHACGFYVFILFPLSWFVFQIIEKQFTFVFGLTFLLFNCIQTHHDNRESYCILYLMLFTFGCIVFTTSMYRISIKFADSHLDGVFGGIFFVLTVLCSISIIMGILIQICEWDEYWTDDEKEVSEWVIKNTDPKSVFISNRCHHDSIVGLSGRSVFSMNANLSTKFNFDVHDRKNAVKEFIMNQNNYSLIKGVEYIAVWNFDSFLFHFFSGGNNWNLVYTKKDICQIYKYQPS